MLINWMLSQPVDNTLRQLSDSTGLAPFVCKVLAARGYSTPEAIASLKAEGETQELQDPMSFLGMQAAVDRIQGAIWLGQQICVYGDYDCDGVTSTALLVTCLKELGAEVIFYVPNRLTEGYGMNHDAVTILANTGVELIITVDNGISSVSEVNTALGLGVDVVVTDHHAIPDGPLPCVPIVNPHQVGCPSVYKEIAGVGVAFYLACALLNKPPMQVLESYGDLVALGSISDVMPLTGDNRIFAQVGVRKLTTGTVRTGIRTLMEVVGANEKSISARTFAFTIGPRVNAAGRMGSATKAVNLMLMDDPAKALPAAKELDALNIERKRIEDEIMKEIEQVLATDPDILRRRVIVACGENWHPGVMGIVASRLVERYGKPSIVFAAADGFANGSGRSIEGVSLIDAVSVSSDLLLRFGGHQQAAGMTVATGNLTAFAEALDAYCVATYPVMPIPRIRIDADADISDFTITNTKALSLLEPFGEGNPAPQIMVCGVTVVDIAPLSQGKHSKVFFKKGKDTFSALYFQMTPEAFPYKENDVVDVMVQLEVGEYKGNEQLTVFLRSIKPHSYNAEHLMAGFETYNRHLRGSYAPGIKSELCPTRQEIAKAFQFVRQRGMTPTSVELASVMLPELTYQKLLVVFDVMTELGFVQKNSGNYLLADAATKRNLEESTILKEMKDVD